jgi:hypothetical protein
MHRFPVDVIDAGDDIDAGGSGHDPVLGRDAEQPGAQPARMRQLRGISHGQAGGDESLAGGGDCRLCIGPEPPGAGAQQRAAVLADHVREHRRAFPLSLGLPEPAH